MSASFEQLPSVGNRQPLLPAGQQKIARVRTESVANVTSGHNPNDWIALNQVCRQPGLAWKNIFRQAVQHNGIELILIDFLGDFRSHRIVIFGQLRTQRIVQGSIIGVPLLARQHCLVRMGRK